MYATRLAIVLLLIVAVLIAYNPQAHEQAVKTWEVVRPVVAQLTDSLYVAIQGLIPGEASGDSRQEMPAPDPRGEFERTVTMNAGTLP